MVASLSDRLQSVFPQRLSRLPAVLWLVIALSATGCQEVLQIMAESASQPGATSTRGRMRAGCATNNTFQCAAAIPGFRLQGVLGESNEYYWFTVSQPRRVFLTLDPMPNERGMSIYVYDAEYRRVGSQGFRRGQPGRFDVVVERPGRYYVMIDPGWGRAGSQDTYTLALSR